MVIDGDHYNRQAIRSREGGFQCNLIAGSNEEVNIASNEFLHAFVVCVGRSTEDELSRKILPLDVTQFLQSLQKCHPDRRSARVDRDNSDAQSFGCLRARRERPCCRATEQRDELAAAAHSITSSARASSVAGISRPSALAVLRLMTKSYLVGACTGRFAGFSPLRMRSTQPAARRNW